MANLTDPKMLRPGTLFADRYVIEERLGAGGMGAVFRVTDTFVGEVIALKLAAVEGEDDEQARALWELQRSEVALARRVTHPHVARVFDLGRFEGVPYITMAFVPGRSLNTVLRDGGLTVVDLVRIGQHIASALAAAHAAGVLHLDLKPDNIVLTEGENPSAVLVDFGIARVLGTPGLGMGTADYLAPEQLEREPLSGAADVFALGCVLHVALSGQHAFPGRSRRQRMLARRTEDPLPLPPTVPRNLAALIRRCLARAPGDRPTATELERALVDCWLALDPDSAASPPPDVLRPKTSSTVDIGAFAVGLGRRVAAARIKLLRLGQEVAALAELDAILAVEPGLPVALALRAVGLVRLWHRGHAATAEERHALADRASQAVAEARSCAAHLADTHLADALIADYAGDLGYAVRALHRAHDHEPLHALSHEVLGRIELEAGVGGVDRLLLAHDLEPRQLTALSIVAREYLLTGRVDEAEALLTTIEREAGPKELAAPTLRLRMCLWHKDRAGARRLVLAGLPTHVLTMQFLVDCAAALDGAFSAIELAECAARTVELSTTSKRRTFIHQLAAEGLATLSPDEALRHALSAARLPFADLRWFDACPALDPLRAAPAFREARSAVQARVHRAFAKVSSSSSPSSLLSSSSPATFAPTRQLTTRPLPQDVTVAATRRRARATTVVAGARRAGPSLDAVDAPQGPHGPQGPHDRRR